MADIENKDIIQSDEHREGTRLAQWAESFNESNAAVLNALGIRISATDLLSPEQFAAVKTVLIAEKRGRTIEDRGLTVQGHFSRAFREMQSSGWAWKEPDGTLFSVTTPTPYRFEAIPEHESLHDRIALAANAHVAVRGVLASIFQDRLVALDDENQNVKHDVLGPALAFAGRASSYKDIMAQQPHLRGGIGPYMRFDVVMASDGGFYVVDMAPKSGAWGFWTRRGELLSEQGMPGTFDATTLDESFTHLKERAGLQRSDTVLVIGGDYGSPTQADIEAIGKDDPVIRIPIVADGYKPKDGEVFLHNTNFHISDEGELQVETPEGLVTVKGVAFWHGYEHLSGSSGGEQGYGKAKQIMQLAAAGKLRLLNHPVPMQILESKILMPLLRQYPDLQSEVIDRLVSEGNISRESAQEMVRLVIETSPQSIILRKQRIRRGEGAPTVHRTFGPDLTWQDTDGTALVNSLGTNVRLIAKPVGSYGAQGIVQGAGADLLSRLDPDTTYEIGLVVDTATFTDLMDPHDYDRGQLVVEHAAYRMRTEVFVSATGTTDARIAGIVHTFLPGKDVKSNDVRIHGGLSMVSIPGP